MKFEKDLELLIEMAPKKIQSLIELRKFRSYKTPRWEEETSDIDIMALLSDESYSSKKDTRQLLGYMITESE